MDRIIGEFQLAEVILAKRELGSRGSNAVRVSGQNIDQRVLRDNADVFSGIETEDRAFKGLCFKLHRGGVEEVGHLLDLDRGGNAVVGDLYVAVHDRRVLILILQIDGANGIVDHIPSRDGSFLYRVLSKREHGRFGMTVAVGDKRRYNGAGAVLHNEGAAGKPCGFIVGAVKLTELGRSGGGADKRFCDLVNADNTFGSLVIHFELRGLGCLYDDHVDKTVDHIRANRGNLLDVVGAAVEIVNQDSAVIAGSDFRDLVRTIGIGIDSELNACKGYVVITVLLDLESAGCRRVHADGSRRHNLCGGRAKKDLLQAVVGRYIRGHVLKRTGVLAGCGDIEGLSSQRGVRRDRQDFTLRAGITGDGDASGETGSIERVTAVDVGQLHRGLPGELITGLGERQCAGSELDVMRQRFLVSRHLKQLVSPFEDVFIPALCTDIGRVRLAVGEGVAAGLAVFGEPETDRVGGRLPSFVLGKTVWRVAGVTVHQDRLEAGESVCAKHLRRCGRGVSCAVGIAVRVFNAVANLTGTFNPMLRGVQILPLGAVVILQIVEGAVGLALNRDVLRKRLFICRCNRRHESEQGNQAHKECQDFCEGVFHVGVLFSFRDMI